MRTPPEPAYLSDRQIMPVLGAPMLGMLLAALDQTIEFLPLHLQLVD